MFTPSCDELISYVCACNLLNAILLEHLCCPTTVVIGQISLSMNAVGLICTKALPLIGRMRFTVFTVNISHRSNLNNTYKK